MFKTIVMTPEEHQTIKALAKIVVEGIVSTVKLSKHERKNLRQNTQPDLLSTSVDMLRGSDLDCATTDTMKVIS